MHIITVRFYDFMAVHPKMQWDEMVTFQSITYVVCCSYAFALYRWWLNKAYIETSKILKDRPFLILFWSYE